MQRIIRILAGMALILIGIALLVLPGPGLLTIFAGLTLMAGEFEWASDIVKWTKEKAARLLSEGRHSRSNRVEPDREEDHTG